MYASGGRRGRDEREREREEGTGVSGWDVCLRCTFASGGCLPGTNIKLGANNGDQGAIGVLPFSPG
jgi:hypothetical protein